MTTLLLLTDREIKKLKTLALNKIFILNFFYLTENNITVSREKKLLKVI